MIKFLQGFISDQFLLKQKFEVLLLHNENETYLSEFLTMSAKGGHVQREREREREREVDK